MLNGLVAPAKILVIDSNDGAARQNPYDGLAVYLE
jgi:hypothetical protein